MRFCIGVHQRDRVWPSPYPRRSRHKKSWFFDRILEKYGESGWTFEPGFPLLDRTILYELQMGIVTGEHSEGLHH
jgi:hypothetical protein